MPDDALNQFRITQSCFTGREGEILVFGENRIGVRFDEVNFVCGGEPQVDPGVAIDREQAIDAFAGVFDVRD